MSLHTTVSNIHKSVKYAIILGGVIFIIFLLTRISGVVYRIAFPPPPVLPNVRFGKLPPVPFPKGSVNYNFNYSLNTLTGKLPEIPEHIRIYKISVDPVTLLNVQKARQKVAAINFTNYTGAQYRETAISPTKYSWEVVSNNVLRSITMDIDTYNFTLSSSYKTYPAVLNQGYAGSEDAAKELLTKYLTAMSLNPNDINPDSTKVHQLMLKNGVLITAPSFSETQVYQIDLYQNDIVQLPIYYPTWPYSTMSFLVAVRASGKDDLLEGRFFHQNIAKEYGVYPLKTAEEAYEELKKGDAYISNYYGTSDNVKITDVKLGYFLANSKQDYLMPVILFQSKDNLYAFVSAIRDDCLITSHSPLKKCQEIRPRSEKNNTQ